MPGRFLQAEPLARADRARAPHGDGLRADDLRRPAAPRRRHTRDLSSLRRGLRRLGAAARADAGLRGAPRRAHLQAWGMTETSPMCTVATAVEDRGHDERDWDDRATAGQAAAVRRAAPHRRRRRGGPVGRGLDGRDRGARTVDRQRATTSDPDGDEKFDDGWLRTGDIARVDEHGCVQITDRSKDVIKSGGEWISSVELENELMAHPAVREAAVIAMPDERWGERPLAASCSTRAPARQRGGAARAPARPRRELVAARRVRVHRRGPEDERRQVRQEGAARAPARGSLEGRVSVGAHPPSPASPAVSPGS